MASTGQPARAERRRARARATGNVQGVGFRPYVFRLAASLGLGGFVRNDERGALIEVEGTPERVEEFLARLPAEAPPLAAVERVVADDAPVIGEREFRILGSERTGQPEALVSPDTTICAECLRELFDPDDRRHRYPFINCTNCGPRFTIVRAVPYDRPLTTMASFEMCAECTAEYEDPRDRRFHAQPNACPACGPALRLTDPAGRELRPSSHRDAVQEAAAQIGMGRIVALKGVGGFHLACRADEQAAVAALRSRKHREDKPFALMAPDLEAARELVELTPPEERLLMGPERPILIARRRPWADVAAAVAPYSRDLGVMLPYSPLHHLLLADAGAPMVMTSGNVSEEPIAYGDADALRRLADIADLFLLHDRPIHMRTDDSVARSLGEEVRAEPVLLRRSRGYVPRSVDLPLETRRPILGCGAELKNTFCVAKRARAWVGHHIGDLKNYETLSAFGAGIEHFERLFAVEPEVVAHDLHPDYLSTKYALELHGVEHVGVQHHHAHLASCLAEHGELGSAVGAIYDGTGYGPDGTVWGGELLLGDLMDYERVGMLFRVPLPGGDAGVREPWRMACSWLIAAEGDPRPPIPLGLRDQVEEGAWQAVCELVASGLNSPLTSSVGRLFDAVAALCGVRPRTNYEGQAAAELEGLSDPAARDAYPLPMIEQPPQNSVPGLVLDAREAVRAIARDFEAGEAPQRIGGRFHEALARATAEACARLARLAATDAVVLSGGAFQNRVLLERTTALLRERGLRVFLPIRLPPNDGGIAYGQVAVAAAHSAADV
jgi:hydrogenase maturation protein HypF